MMKTQGLNEEQFKEQTGLSKKRYIRKYKKDIIVSVTVQNVEEFLVEKGKAK